MKHISIGGLDVSRIGLGAMSMSGYYNTGEGSEAESIRAIHRALDLGVTHIDTAEIYGPYHNEELVGRAIRDRRDQVVLATKFGIVSHAGGGAGVLDSSPANIRTAVEGSLKRLGTDYIDLYYQHRIDPNTAIEDTVGALAELVAEGKVRHIGRKGVARTSVVGRAFRLRSETVAPRVRHDRATGSIIRHGPIHFRRSAACVQSPDNPAVTIRPAARADLPALGRLGALLVRTHHDFDPVRFIAAVPQTEQAYAAYLERQLGEPRVIVLVAEREGEVIGYAYAGVEGPDYMALRGPAGVLYDILVDPARRGNGVGRMLLNATLATLKARGAPRVVLSTAERNVNAQRLFARAGFRRTMIEMTHELGDDAG